MSPAGGGADPASSARLSEADWIWKDGDFVAWKDATVHLLSLAVQFGSSIFEGIRCYDTPGGPAVFRLPSSSPPFSTKKLGGRNPYWRACPFF